MGVDQFKSRCTCCEVTPSFIPTEMDSVGAACYQVTHPHVPKSSATGLVQSLA